MSNSPRRKAIKTRNLIRKQARKFMLITGHRFVMFGSFGVRQLIESQREMASAYRERSVVSLLEKPGHLEAVSRPRAVAGRTRNVFHPPEPATISLRRNLASNDVTCDACGATVWREVDGGSPTKVMYDHVRAAHIPEGVIASRFAEPTGRGDFAVMQFRSEEEHQLQRRVDAWIRENPTSAFAAAGAMEAACRHDSGRAELYATIRRELARRGWKDCATTDHEFCDVHAASPNIKRALADCALIRRRQLPMSK
jgi:hypothetical protein